MRPGNARPVLLVSTATHCHRGQISTCAARLVLRVLPVPSPRARALFTVSHATALRCGRTWRAQARASTSQHAQPRSTRRRCLLQLLTAHVPRTMCVKTISGHGERRRQRQIGSAETIPFASRASTSLWQLARTMTASAPFAQQGTSASWR